MGWKKAIRALRLGSRILSKIVHMQAMGNTAPDTHKRTPRRASAERWQDEPVGGATGGIDRLQDLWDSKRIWCRVPPILILGGAEVENHFRERFP